MPRRIRSEAVRAAGRSVTVSKLRPVGRNIVAKVEEKKMTATGLYLSDVAAKQLAPKKAHVVAIGPDVASVDNGDEIIYKIYATFEVNLGDKEQFIVLEESDVLAVIDK